MIRVTVRCLMSMVRIGFFRVFRYILVPWQLRLEYVAIRIEEYQIRQTSRRPGLFWSRTIRRQSPVAPASSGPTPQQCAAQSAIATAAATKKRMDKAR